MVSGLILCVIVVRLLKINSSLKDVWNLSLPSLPLHLICSCRHLSLLKLRRVLPVSQSLEETKSPSNTQRRNGELFHVSFRKDETVHVPSHPKADLVVKEEGMISQECWQRGSGKCLPKAQMGCYSSSLSVVCLSSGMQSFDKPPTKAEVMTVGPSIVSRGRKRSYNHSHYFPCCNMKTKIGFYEHKSLECKCASVWNDRIMPCHGALLQRVIEWILHAGLDSRHWRASQKIKTSPQELIL